MKLNEVMAELEKCGTAQNRKVYARHGVDGEMFGVSYANLGKLQKRIRCDHALALALWDTGNHDARVLATKVADPDKLTPRILDKWVKDLADHTIAGALGDLTARTPAAWKTAIRWARSKEEWIGRAGWMTVAKMAVDYAALPEKELMELLQCVGREIHQRKNRTRDAMLWALIAIGARNRALHREAEAVARKIGRVEVDHGETCCQTPEPIAYMQRTVAHRGYRFS